jgi:hypothetical protein
MVNNSFDKVVIWGLPLHSHTHSYIHDCFFKAFQSMGMETVWVQDTTEKIENSFLDNSLVIATGMDCKTLSINDSCFYVLHNVEDHRFRQHDNYINLQVYTKDTLLPARNAQRLSTCRFTYWQEDSRCLYQPWATDLLPEEMIYDPVPAPKVNKSVNWVGSITSGEQGNQQQLQEYAKAMWDIAEIPVHVHRNVSQEGLIKLIRSSNQAPAIVARWQRENLYVPCRLFKNISYGQPTFSNSPVVKEICGEDFYEEDCTKLAIKTNEYLKNRDLDLEKGIIDLVRQNHTFVNRCNRILEMIDGVR